MSPTPDKPGAFLRLLLVTEFDHSLVVCGVVGAGAEVVAVVEAKAAETSVKGRERGVEFAPLARGLVYAAPESKFETKALSRESL